MASLIRRMGHVIKHSPEITRNYIIISKLKKQTEFNKIPVGLNRKTKIIVSLTSYSKRFETLDICIKSILNQTLLPDRLILYLSKNENVEDIPKPVRDLQNYGLEIKFVDLDLKPHKKYYYAMKDFPDDIIITLDDDIIYDKNLISELYKTHKKFPNCIVAARAHKIRFDSDNKIAKYNNWEWCSTESNEPSFLFLATEGAGTLYPPHLLNKHLLFNLEYINKYINADDLWMKAVELVSHVPVVIANPKLEKKRIEIPEAQDVALAKNNVGNYQNDAYLKELEKDFHILSKIKNLEYKFNNQ